LPFRYTEQCVNRKGGGSSKGKFFQKWGNRPVAGNEIALHDWAYRAGRRKFELLERSLNRLSGSLDFLPPEPGFFQLAGQFVELSNIACGNDEKPFPRGWD
jgi:phage tail sheath protein FI